MKKYIDILEKIIKLIENNECEFICEALELFIDYKEYEFLHTLLQNSYKDLFHYYSNGKDLGYFSDPRIESNQIKRVNHLKEIIKNLENK